jgi:hypothetical protein
MQIRIQQASFATPPYPNLANGKIPPENENLVSFFIHWRRTVYVLYRI